MPAPKYDKRQSDLETEVLGPGYMSQEEASQYYKEMEEAKRPSPTGKSDMTMKRETVLAPKQKRVTTAPAPRYAKGGKISSASKRADGCAQRGKTRGRMV